MEIEEVGNCEALPLLSLNHVSILCRSVWESVRFYEEVLGFVLIKRPSSFKFNGAWLASCFAHILHYYTNSYNSILSHTNSAETHQTPHFSLYFSLLSYISHLLHMSQIFFLSHFECLWTSAVYKLFS